MAEVAEKPKQARLPGMTPKRIQDIQDAAENLKELRDDRMDLAEKEEQAQEKLKAVMKKHNVKHYRLDDNYEAVLEADEPRAYVRKVKRKKKPAAKKGAEE